MPPRLRTQEEPPMNRPLLTLTVVLIVALAHPTPAAAGFWAWLEEWSGPGPFRARVLHTFLFTTCVQDAKDNGADDPVARGHSILKPSPIAMNDTFHQTQGARARILRDAINRASPNTPQVTEPTVVKKLLANPDLAFGRIGDSLAASIAQAKGVAPTGQAAEAVTTDSLVEFYKGPQADYGPGHK